METTIQNNIRTRYIFKSILFCVVFTGLFVVFSIAKNFVPNNFERLAHGIIGTLAAFLTTVLFLKFDRKQFCDIGLTFEQKAIVKFFTGVLVGIGIMGLLATSLIYFTNVGIVTNPGSNFLNFLLMTLPLIPLAFMEELGFRAYPLEILKDKVGIWLSIIITSILFALYHIANGWTIVSSFSGPAVWGLVFGLAAIHSKGIAMPTGIHYAANLTTSAFGAANNTVSIWVIKQTNPSTKKYGGIDWVTILPALALLVFATICIELYIRQRTAANSSLSKAGLTEKQSAIVR
ncbi:CPBP family intramembrane glutamic endopeptidase [Flavihumibacter fluvii]|uniref:CPBP family intramembrane glutamic endopeptidase n=1 Tax=Flavihumibacter fluvii TaxID=2838157 RepID=UPI001BDEECF2|nr:type II CAAX endopeptidase family protein [Flavihumibacter fluvii]ULQ53384.1 CPBP family intramembrane metalloprotease [Flavihumibacter fluvii]